MAEQDSNQKKPFKQIARDYFKELPAVLKKRWWVILIEFVALAALLVADLVSKKYVTEFLLGQPTHSYEWLPGFIHLTYSENTGAGFGMLGNSTTLLTVVTFIVIIGVLIYLIIAQKQSEWLRAPLLLIVGGGIGNLVDRLGLKYVRDFIEYAFLKNFPICNLADVFVTVGAVMLVIVLIVMLVKEGRKNAKEFEAERANAPKEPEIDPLDQPININPMLSSPNTYTFEISEQNADEEQSVSAEQSVDTEQNVSAEQNANAEKNAATEQNEGAKQEGKADENANCDEADKTQSDKDNDILNGSNSPASADGEPQTTSDAPQDDEEQ